MRTFHSNFDNLRITNTCPDGGATIRTKGRKGGKGQEAADYFRLLITGLDFQQKTHHLFIAATTDKNKRINCWTSCERRTHSFIFFFFYLPIAEISQHKCKKQFLCQCHDHQGNWDKSQISSLDQHVGYILETDLWHNSIWLFLMFQNFRVEPVHLKTNDTAAIIS